MLSRVTVSNGLEVCSLKSSRLDDWFLGAGPDSRPRSASVPFFPDVHKEVAKSWTATFMVGNHSSPSSLPSMAGWLGGTLTPQVERAAEVHLCPANASPFRNYPRLPSKACKLSVVLAAGQATSALHAMEILQVHQAKALKQMHEDSTDPRLMQELCMATDFALRAKKVIV